MVVLYLDPLDYPGDLLARLWVIGPGWKVPQEKPWVLAPRAIEPIRASLRASGYVSVRLSDDADPAILEEWIPATELWGRG